MRKGATAVLCTVRELRTRVTYDSMLAIKRERPRNEKTSTLPFVCNTSFELCKSSRLKVPSKAKLSFRMGYMYSNRAVLFMASLENRWKVVLAILSNPAAKDDSLEGMSVVESDRCRWGSLESSTFCGGNERQPASDTLSHIRR